MGLILLIQAKSPKLFSSLSNLVFTSQTTKIISLTILYVITMKFALSMMLILPYAGEGGVFRRLARS